MADIVKQLQNGTPNYDQYDNPNALALSWWEDYIGPQALAEIERLRKALGTIAVQRLSTELPDDEWDNIIDAYDLCIEGARSLLSPEQEQES